MSLSQDVEHLTALIYSKLPHTAGETSADSEATLVGLEGTWNRNKSATLTIIFKEKNNDKSVHNS